ncbi:MAG: CRISPR system precrRNA processing endoribonuclease RAMP protein Cas6 [bacterium]
MQLKHYFEALSLGRYRLTITLKERARLPEYKGSTLRGGFGYVFKRLVCSARHPSCEECILKTSCPYSYVFETPRPQDAKMMRLYPQIPRPFVINPPRDKRRELTPGDTLEFGLVLIGKAIDSLPYFVYTFDKLGDAGLGVDRARFELSRVNAVLADGRLRTVYDPDKQTIGDGCAVAACELVGRHAGSRLTLHFHSPLRLRSKGKIADRLQFRPFFATLLRRVSALSYFHCGLELKLDFKGLVEAASTVERVADETRWYRWGRFSKRQGRRIELGGLLGKVSFEGELDGFWPWLELGEVLHVGKATTFGLGDFELVDSALEKA